MTAARRLRAIAYERRCSSDLVYKILKVRTRESIRTIEFQATRGAICERVKPRRRFYRKEFATAANIQNLGRQRRRAFVQRDDSRATQESWYTVQGEVTQSLHTMQNVLNLGARTRHCGPQYEFLFPTSNWGYLRQNL